MAVKKICKGNWCTRYYAYDEKGNLVSKYKSRFKTEADAYKYELAHKNKPITTDNQIVTFWEMFENWSDYNNASDETNSTRSYRLTTYASQIIDRPISKISKSDLLDWRSTLYDENRIKTETKNMIIGIVKSVFRYAYEVYDVYDSGKILKRFDLELDDYNEMTIINFSQLEKLISFEEDETLRILFWTLYMTGMRLGEARALKKSDFNGSSIKIYKSMRRYTKSVKTTKRPSSIRVVPVDAETSKKLSLLASKRGEYLFGDAKPINLTTLRRHFKEDLAKADLPDMRIHDLRHSHVSLLWANHVPVPEISKRIGHASPAVTMSKYAHIFDNDQLATLSVLNNLH